MPIVGELSQGVTRFAVVNKQLHVGSTTRKMIAGRRIPNILYHIGMGLYSLGKVSILIQQKGPRLLPDYIYMACL